FAVPTNLILPLNPYLVSSDSRAYSDTDNPTGVDAHAMARESARQMLARMQGQAAGTRDWFKEAFAEQVFSDFAFRQRPEEIAEQQQKALRRAVLNLRDLAYGDLEHAMLLDGS